ncbi:MAG TPA: DUF3987 domain-containing protein [Candidatus Acidoferrum sp.]|nr:DUF3987 domain-containing protein [Candidatus Acidoferrum sp.]
MHSPLRDERTGSLDFKIKNGRIVLYDHGDPTAKESDLCAALGLAIDDLYPNGKQAQQVLATYAYYDEDNVLLYRIHRKPGKKFVADVPNGKGGFNSGPGCMDGVRKIVYNLPAVLAATEIVWLAEGEKDSNSLTDRGLVAATSPFGAGKWRAEYAESFRGKNVVILADNDDPKSTGRDHAIQVATSLHSVAASVKVIFKLPLPHDKFAKDITDWFEAGFTAEMLRALAEDVPLWTPNAAAETASVSAWADPLPLERELLDVPLFDAAWLPDPFCASISEISDQMQLPLAYAGAATIATLAGAVGRRALVHPKLLDDRWQEALNLAVALIGPVGIKKTPVLQAVTAPLEKIQGEWMKIREVDLEEYERAQTLIRLEQEAWESQMKAAMKAGTTRPARPDDTLWAPQQRRLIVVDSTAEKLHAILADNPGGLLCIRDELVGLIADLGKQGRESERSFWLSLLNGKGAHVMDRILRGTTYTPNICGSLLGNAVPSRIKFFLTSVMSGGVEDDGFFSRILMVWPDLPANWSYVDRRVNATIADECETVYRTLTRLSGTDPVHLRFSAAAQEIFIDWLGNLERTVIRGGAVPAVLVGHLAKYRKFLPTIAAIYEMVDRAVTGDLTTKLEVEQPYAFQMRAHRSIQLEPDANPPDVEISEMTLISADNMQRAIETCDFFAKHAERVYSSVAGPGATAGNSLARRIQKGDLKSGFTSREVERHHWADLGTPELVTAALRYLEDLRWIRSRKAPTSEQGGRPSITWEINPKLKAGA